MKNLKACILAGGEGTRLRPLTCRQPKPMVRLFDKPVLAHILDLLARCGVEECVITLMYLPGAVMEYFGDSYDGMRLRYTTEIAPRGTAGAAADACGDFTDDFIVISGDAVCDFDLTKAVSFHKEKHADVTVLTACCAQPLEYGLISAEQDGQISEFFEKPDWEHTFGNKINTGIYVLSPKILRGLPRNGMYDFAKELFPVMLQGKKKLFACEMSGYWCDMGDPETYLGAACDVLEGNVKLELEVKQFEHGVFCEKLPKNARIIPPVFISDGAIVEDGAIIGPYAVLENGARIGRDAHIERSICRGRMRSGSHVDGAVVDSGADIGVGASVNRRCVVGAGAVIGDGCMLGNDVRVWDSVRLQSNERVENDVKDMSDSGVFFNDGCLTNPSPEQCFALGIKTAATVGLRQAVGGIYCAAAESFIAGLAVSGAEVIRHDASHAASAAYAVTLMKCGGGAVFTRRENGKLCMRMFDESGSTPSVAILKKLTAKHDVMPQKAATEKAVIPIIGMDRIYASECSSSKLVYSDIGVLVEGLGGAAETVRETLRLSGTEENVHNLGKTMTIVPDTDGKTFEIIDANGTRYDSNEVMLMLLKLQLEHGVKRITITDNAPMACDDLAAEYSAVITRNQRDGGNAKLLYRYETRYRRAAEGVIKLITGLNGRSIGDLARSLPDCATAETEIDLTRARADIMQTVANGKEASFCTDGGWVKISPSATRNAVRIHAEGPDAEFASELCSAYADIVRKLDGQNAT